MECPKSKQANASESSKMLQLMDSVLTDRDRRQAKGKHMVAIKKRDKKEQMK